MKSGAVDIKRYDLKQKSQIIAKRINKNIFLQRKTKIYPSHVLKMSLILGEILP